MSFLGPKILADDITGDISTSLKTRANIVLISILVPIALIALIVLVVSLWIWNRTFKQQKRQVESRRRITQSSRLQNESDSDGNNQKIVNKRCPCFCNPMLWNKRNESFKPYMMRISGKRGNFMNRLKSNTNRTSRITGYDEFRKTPNMIQLTPIDNTCQIASNSHATLSSHFEENNWDYNFATRGLYLAQPWMRGELEHNEVVVPHSYAGSVVLTLEPCDKDVDSPTMASNNDGIVNGGFSDTDGYYA